MRRLAALLAALSLAVSTPAFADVAVGNGGVPQVCNSPTWAPTDQSGASIPLTVTTATYCKTGLTVWINVALTYPATAAAGNASFSLPFASAAGTFPGGGFSNYYSNSATVYCGAVNPASVALNIITCASSGFVTNVTASTLRFSFSGTYQAAS